MKKTPIIFSLMSLLILTSCTFALTSSSQSSSSESSENSSSSSSQASSSTESSSSESSSSESSSSSTTSPYSLIWSDEFSTTQLNEDGWSYMYGDGSNYGIPGWGNGEAEYYTKKNVRLENGQLIMTAKAESLGGKSYTSGRLRTAGKVSTTYGRIEASISLPAVAGLWPAFWMLPESTTPYGGWAASGEIDIMEAKGRVNTSTSGALHFGDVGSSTYITNSQTFTNATFEGFHVYAIEWEQDEIRWYVDDRQFLSVTSEQWWSANSDRATAPFDVDFHILLNLAVGGHFDGYTLPPTGFSSAEMCVDYIRIYEKNV
jgi:beta-glucanase (GH16 family)